MPIVICRQTRAVLTSCHWLWKGWLWRVDKRVQSYFVMSPCWERITVTCGQTCAVLPCHWLGERDVCICTKQENKFCYLIQPQGKRSRFICGTDATVIVWLHGEKRLHRGLLLSSFLFKIFSHKPCQSDLTVIKLTTWISKLHQNNSRPHETIVSIADGDDQDRPMDKTVIIILSFQWPAWGNRILRCVDKTVIQKVHYYDNDSIPMAWGNGILSSVGSTVIQKVH